MSALAIGVAAALTYRSAHADSPLRHIAFLAGLPLADPISRERVDAITGRLAQLGWVAGQTVRFSIHVTEINPDNRMAVARRMLEDQPDVIVTSSGPETAAAIAATRTIPIVFSNSADPVASGFVKSPARPDGNVTGFSDSDPAMAPKWIELLTELAPSVERISVIYNPDTAPGAGRAFLDAMRADAGGRGSEIHPQPVADIDRIPDSLRLLSATPGAGLVILPDSFVYRRRADIVRYIAEARIPAIYPYSEFTLLGGLMSYSGAHEDRADLMATYVDLILRGANVAELPVRFSRKFEFTINAATAAQLGLAITPDVRARAPRIFP